MSAERKELGVVGELASRRYGLASNSLAILLRASKNEPRTKCSTPTRTLGTMLFYDST